MAHDQDQQIIEQPVDRRLPAAIIGKGFRQQQIADRRQRRVRRKRQQHEFGQPLADRIAGFAAQIDRCADKIGAAPGAHRETVRAAAREEDQHRLVNRDIGHARPAQRQRALLQQVEMPAIAELRGRAQIAREKGPGGGGGVGEERGKDIHGTICNESGTNMHR